MQMSDDRKAHWEDVYSRKSPAEVSWYQPEPRKSLEFIAATGAAKDVAILDVGGGASTLVDCLLDAGYTNLSVLDIAATALRHSRARLGARANDVTWIVADVTSFEPQQPYSVWHDRAVFHFLTSDADRLRYLAVLKTAVQRGGSMVLATFGPEGPLRCSGLDIQRYDKDQLLGLFGNDFKLESDEIESHQTPAGTTQQFLFTRWSRV